MEYTMRDELPNDEPRQLSAAEVRRLRLSVAREVLDATATEEWGRYVLDAEPETASLLNFYRPERF